jgi:hypothetical protein
VADITDSKRDLKACLDRCVKTRLAYILNSATFSPVQMNAYKLMGYGFDFPSCCRSDALFDEFNALVRDARLLVYMEAKDSKALDLLIKSMASGTLESVTLPKEEEAPESPTKRRRLDASGASSSSLEISDNNDGTVSLAAAAKVTQQWWERECRERKVRG